jgi:hypothetical protein
MGVGGSSSAINGADGFFSASMVRGGVERERNDNFDAPKRGRQNGDGNDPGCGRLGALASGSSRVGAGRLGAGRWGRVARTVLRARRGGSAVGAPGSLRGAERSEGGRRENRGGRGIAGAAAAWAGRARGRN